MSQYGLWYEQEHSTVHLTQLLFLHLDVVNLSFNEAEFNITSPPQVSEHPTDEDHDR